MENPVCNEISIPSDEVYIPPIQNRQSINDDHGVGECRGGSNDEYHNDEVIFFFVIF